jgi:DNA polymerase elongation subunit (family B)
MYIKVTPARAQEFVAETDAFYRELVKSFNVDMSRWIVELEYENHFKSIFFVRKKRYAGLMSYFKGKPADYLEVKGLEFMRSDGLQYARQMQHDVMNLALRESPTPLTIAKLIVERLKKVLSKTLPVGEVQMTQSIEKDVGQYKTRPPHVRVAEHIKVVAPTEYYIGMKVPYVMIGPKDAVWSVEYDPAVKTYDPEVLWNKKIFPPTDRVLKTIYPAYDWEAFYL